MSLVYDLIIDDSKRIIVKQGCFDIIAGFKIIKPKPDNEYKTLVNEIRKELLGEVRA
jgi:hypothetical protein